MNIYINSERLRRFNYGLKSYKGLTIGQTIILDDITVELGFLKNNLAEVTGFSVEHDVVHWMSESKYGGICRSGSFIGHMIGS